MRLPLHSSGQVGIELNVSEDHGVLSVHGEEIEIVLSGTARYVEHLDKSQ